MPHIKQVFIIAVTYALLLSAWELTASLVEGFPSPQSTYYAAFGGTNAQGEDIKGVLPNAFIIEDDEEQGIFWHLASTMGSVFGGFALVLFVGLPLGILVGLSRTFESSFNVITHALKIIPPIVWLPFVLLLFQDTTMVALFTVFIAALWPVVSSTAQGVSSVDKEYLKMSEVLHLTRTERLIEVILPLVVPYVFEGMRRSLWVAWLTILPVEMLLEEKGLGFWIWNAYDEGSNEHIIIGLFIVYLLSLIVDYILKLIADYFDYMHEENK